MSKTTEQYNAVITKCKDIFVKKTKDYGTAWRILRLISLTDQIFIKAQRIRTIEDKGKQKIVEGRTEEFIGIINYCIMAIIQLELPADYPLEIPLKEATQHYDNQLIKTRDLMLAKNHDYGEAWRSMRISSMTDLILMKLLRIKQIEDNRGQTLISEGIAAGYSDIVNYAVFALIKLDEHSCST